MPQSRIYQPGGGSGGGGGGSDPAADGVLVNFHDAYSTVVPATDATLIDGGTVITGTLVLFTNLITDNNTVQSAAVDGGGNITWTIEPVFTSSLMTPSDLDRVSVHEGDQFADNFYYWSAETGEFRNLINTVSELVVPDSSINSQFASVDTNFYKSMRIKYLITRNGQVAMGTLFVASNGSSAYSSDNRPIDPGPVNVIFGALMSGSTLIAKVSTVPTGFAATIQMTVEVV
jgi:hypothetical protein